MSAGKRFREALKENSPLLIVGTINAYSALQAPWSSIWAAAAPALISSLIVLAILKAPPKPVSASTSKGVSTQEVMRLTSIHTSSSPTMPKSGSP